MVNAKRTELDPGPVPLTVEPPDIEGDTIPVTPRTHVEVTGSPAGCTRLAVESAGAGARMVVDLPPQAVNALVWALVRHTPREGGRS